MKTMFYIIKGMMFGYFLGTFTYMHKWASYIAIAGMVVFVIFDLAYFKKRKNNDKENRNTKL